MCQHTILNTLKESFMGDKSPKSKDKKNKQIKNNASKPAVQPVPVADVKKQDAKPASKK